ncbi:MAG: methyltransferase domain-containing protein [Planctomycetes bacterium]|nr:methyltransferase domain-containing protein [Planctomycetota bacterium]
MKESLLDYLVSPDDRQPFELEVRERREGEVWSGALLSRRAGTRYPILKGIPRIVPGVREEADLRRVYADSFGHEWLAYNWLRDEDEPEFRAITDLAPDDVKGLAVLDGGCGGGRVARFLAPKARVYIGIDYSVACERARELCRECPGAHFLQADLCNLPLRGRAFDFVFSHGVIHHTPHPRRAFSHLSRVARPGSRLYLAVFRKTFLPLRIPDLLLRGVLSRLPSPRLDRVCDRLGVLNRLPAPRFWKRFLWFSMQSDPEVRKCCNYDWYGPRYHTEHSVEEVLEWFRQEGFEETRYINAWPYCPPGEKYRVPGLLDSFRLGQLLGVLGRKTDRPAERGPAAYPVATPRG